MKIAIVGGGVTMLDAPFNDKDCLIWTTASVSKSLPKVDCIFEFHNKEAFQDESVYSRCKVIYKKDFPIDALVKQFGEVFNSSMTMMLAYASTLENCKEIELYGVDNALDEEYAKYRAYFLYVLGLVRGMGRSVKISDGSLLMPQVKRYGYQKDYKTIKLEAMKKDLEQLKMNCEYMRGAVDAASTFAKF